MGIRSEKSISGRELAKQIFIYIHIHSDNMPKQVMLSDTAYRMLVQRKGEKSFSKVIIELMVDKKAAAKDPKKLLEINGIIKTKKPVSWSTQVDDVLYGDKL